MDCIEQEEGNVMEDDVCKEIAKHADDVARFARLLPGAFKSRKFCEDNMHESFRDLANSLGYIIEEKLHEPDRTR